MAERIGICQGCNARYRIPATFAGTRAKCKKCGGIVNVTAAERSAPTPAPASRAAPAKAPAPAASGEKRTGRTRGAASSRSARRRGKGGDAEAGARGRSRGGSSRKSNTGILIAAGLLVVAGGGGLFYMLKGGEEEATTTASAATGNEEATPAAGEETPGTTPEVLAPEEPIAAEPPAPDPAAEAAAGEATPAEAAPPEAPAAEPEEVVTVLAFEPFGPNEGTSAEDWAAISEAVEGMKFGGKGRKRSMDSLKEYELAAVPALINTFNGLDLADGTAWRDAYEVAIFIQETLTYGTIQIPFKGDYSEDPEVVSYNVKALNSLVNYWRQRQDDPALLQRTQELFEEKKAAAQNG